MRPAGADGRPASVSHIFAGDRERRRVGFVCSYHMSHAKPVKRNHAAKKEACSDEQHDENILNSPATLGDA